MAKKLYTGDPDETCPLRGGKLCVKVCPTCKFQQSFTVTNNVTGGVSVHWDCALTFQTQLLMEGNLFTQGVGQAVEGFRNETTARGNALLGGSVKLAEHVIAGVTRAEKERINGDGQRLSLARPSGADAAGAGSDTE